MLPLRQIRISTRLNMGFGLMLVLLLLLGGFGMLQVSRMNAIAEDLGESWLPSVSSLGAVRAKLNEVRRITLRMALEDTPEGRARQLALHDKAMQEEIPPLIKAYEKVITSPEEQKLYEELKSTWRKALQSDQQLIDLIKAGDSAKIAQYATGESAVDFAAVMVQLGKSVQLNEDGGVQAVQSARSTYKSAVTVSIVVLAVAVVFGLVLARLITLSITAPLRGAIQVAETVASGDLTSQIRIEGRDDVTDLLQAMLAMNDHLLKVVSLVRESSENIDHGASEIAAGNADLSQRTEEQASNLEETAASMEELTSTVRTNSDTAQQANQLAISASNAATKGGEVVNEVVHTMQGIVDASRKISDIIGVIDGIAFQTNILALNAAVEAARAGDQGRGFAVVASEVRSLAGRSADAAKEIKALIGNSVERVESGTRLVNDAGKNMEAIVNQVQNVGVLINAISSASIEQTAGISQVGDAVNQLDQVTQQNAALVEQSAAAADSLKSQAKRLAEVVATFRLSDTQQQRSAAVPAPTRAAVPAARPASLNAGATKRPATSAAPAPKAASLPQPKAAAKGNEDWESF